MFEITPFEIGSRFLYEFRSPWSGPGKRGIERTLAIICITAHTAEGRQFDYEVLRILSTIDPIPEPAKRREPSKGGMTREYAAQLVATGQMLPVFE